MDTGQAEEHIRSTTQPREESSRGVASASNQEIDANTIISDQAMTITGESVAADLPGNKIGKYEIRQQLGTGGMGAVYLGFDPLIEREVAIKVLSQTVSASDSAIKRFLQEARSIGKLNHPNVVSIYDIDQWNGHYFIVMELLSGGSLSQAVKDKGPLPWRDACRIAAQAASGLSAAHAAGMVHRDVKPENLMMSRDGQVKVVDFGLSKLVDNVNDTRSGVTKVGQILGTPQYMSPEQFESAEVDARTDIYSLGATLFRLLTGRYPFHDFASIVQVMTAHLTKPVPDISEFVPDLPEGIQRVIVKAMAKIPDERYQSASEMADDLNEIIRREGDRTNTVAAPALVECRPLKTVLLIEPSKMQAAMMKDAVTRSGAEKVVVMQAAADAMREMQSVSFDLLITAMQLPDEKGIDMIRRATQAQLVDRSCVVLNSNDSTIVDLLECGSAASLVLAPKRTKPDDILRVVHAVGPVEATLGSIVNPIDPLTMRLVVVNDFGKMPDSLAEMIRKTGLLDVVVLGAVEANTLPADDAATVVVSLRTAGRSEGDSHIFTRMISDIGDSRYLTAAIQVDAGEMYLRAVHRQGVTGATYQRFDYSRLLGLIQACRPA